MQAPWTVTFPGSNSSPDSFGVERVRAQMQTKIWRNHVGKLIPAPLTNHEVGDRYGVLLDFEDEHWGGAAFLIYRPVSEPQGLILAVIAHGLLQKFPAHPYIHPMLGLYVKNQRVSSVPSASFGPEKASILEIKRNWMQREQLHGRYYGFDDGLVLSSPPVNGSIIDHNAQRSWRNVCLEPRPTTGKYYFESKSVDQMDHPAHMMMGFSFEASGASYAGSNALSYGYRSDTGVVEVYHNGAPYCTPNPVSLVVGDSLCILLDFDDPYWNGAAFAFFRNGTQPLKFLGLIASGLKSKFPTAEYPYFYPISGLWDHGRKLSLVPCSIDEPLQCCPEIWHASSAYALDLSQSPSSVRNVFWNHPYFRIKGTIAATVFGSPLKPSTTLTRKFFVIQMLEAGTTRNWRIGFSTNNNHPTIAPGVADGFNVGVWEYEPGKWRLQASTNKNAPQTSDETFPILQALDRISFLIDLDNQQIQINFIENTHPLPQKRLFTIPIPPQLLNCSIYPAVFLGDSNSPNFLISSDRPSFSHSGPSSS